MASVVKRADRGSYEIRFFTAPNQRRSFFPGASSTKRQAESIGIKLDKLVFAVSQSESPPLDVAEWLRTLNDKQHRKLAKWGLVEERTRVVQGAIPVKQDKSKLRGWTRHYIASGRRKAPTIEQLDRVADNLCRFFGDDRPIADIHKGDAEDFRQWLETKAREVGEGEAESGLAHNTVRRRIGRAKEMFRAAMKRQLITANPFEDERSAVGANVERQFFVPHEWIEKCIQVAPCEDWRIMLAFARYSGMRSHETRIQRWDDIDLPNSQMVIRSNKTPPERACPIFPALMPHLLRAKEYAPDGAEFVQTRYTHEQNVLETFRKIIVKAGLKPWPKLMQNLRATRETELLAEFPAKDVSSWLGNSVAVAMKHYAMRTEKAFERAKTEDPAKAHQIAHHATPLDGVSEQLAEYTEEEIEHVLALLDAIGGDLSYPARNRTIGRNTGIERCRARCSPPVPPSLPITGELAELLSLWESFDDAARRDLLGVARELASHC